MIDENDEQQWLREMVAALPSPAMPAEVRDRLDAAIAAEAAQVAAVPPQHSDTVAPVVPAQSRGQHRRSWLLGMTGVAAAMVLFAMVNPFGATMQQPGEFDAAVESEATGGSDDAGQTSAATLEAAVAQVLRASQTSYTEEGLASQAQTVAAQDPVPGRYSEPAAEAAPPRGWSTADADAARPAAAAACVSALPAGEAGADLALVDLADFEGAPAIVVARRSAQGLEVFVLNPRCESGDPAIEYRATVEAP